MKTSKIAVSGENQYRGSRCVFTAFAQWTRMLCCLAALLLLGACNETSAQATEHVSGVSADSKVILFWDKVDGAQSYNIYWNSTGKGNAEDEHTSADSPPFEISGLRDDSTYYFRVTSVSSAGEGAPSEPIVLRPTSARPQSIVVSPNERHMAVGTRQYFIATGVYSDGSTQDVSRLAKWTSSDTATVTVQKKGRGAGLVSAIDSGSASISATFRGITGNVTVLPVYAHLRHLTVLAHDPQIAVDTQLPFKAVGHFDNFVQNLTASVTWISSNPEVAHIHTSPGREGIVEAEEIGESTISASFGGIQAQSLLYISGASLQSIRLIPNEPSIALGLEQAFTAIGIYSDGTSVDITPNIIWESSDPSVATVSNYSSAANATAAGVAQTLEGHPGTTAISARLQNVSAKTTLTVSEPQAVSMKLIPESVELAVGTTTPFTHADIFYSDGTSTRYPVDSSFSFMVSDSGIATMEANGLVRGVTPGNTTITATFTEVPALSASATVVVYAMSGLPPDHDLMVFGCYVCHDNNTASGKPASHPITTNLCEACHSNTDWLSLVIPFAHDQAMDSCIACHDNVITVGKGALHPNTSDLCETCHSTMSWLPTIFDHSTVAGQACAGSGCHDGTSSVVYKPATHPLTTDACEACHNSAGWLPLLIPFDHSQVITPFCSDCHSASLPVNHCPTKDDCSNCHEVFGWLPATATCPTI